MRSLERVPSWLLLLAVAACVTAALYGPVLTAPFVFDDAKFLNEPALQAGSGADLARLIAAPGIPRKVGMLTFALNHWRLGRFSPAEVRAVSFALHAANALLLFLLLRGLCRTLGVGKAPPDWALALGVLAWLVHPLQTQAVSYAWQRFTPLCTCFFLLTLLAVLRARDASGRRRAVWTFCAMAAAFLALGSKENAGALPIFAMLVLLLFPARGVSWSPGRLLPAAVGLTLLAPVIAAFYLGPNAWEMILRDSLQRGFTPWQRVMTEWRVVVYYVTLIAWPSPARLNLDYDWPLSTGLFEPVTTFPSLCAIVAATLFGLWSARRGRPLVAFAVFWFVGNLAIESTFIPLDLVFEHRLYLPSMVPVALSVAWLSQRPTSVGGRTALAALLLAWLSIWTVERNRVWRDPVALWEDTVQKSPGKARPHWNLGKAYLVNREYERARQETQRALDLDPTLIGAYNNLATIEIAQGDLERAEASLTRGLKVAPDDFALLTNLGIVLMKEKRHREAIDPLERASKIEPENETAAASLVAALYGSADYPRAAAAAREQSRRHPRSARLFAFEAAALLLQGKPEEARAAALEALRLDPNDPVARDVVARLK